MDGQKKSKMTRQLQIYYTLTHARIIGPDDITVEFGISRRMLQRDLKDLRDAGLLSISYDRAADNYVQDPGITTISSDFLTFADFFFDGFIADILVQSKINEARGQVNEAIRRTQELLTRLRQYR